MSPRNSVESDGDPAALVLRLQERVRQMEELMAQVAHDLKRPLVAIESCVEFLKEDLAQGNRGRQEQDLRDLTAEAATMRRLLTELLDLARVGRLDLVKTGESSPPPEICHMPSLVDQAVQSARRTDRGSESRFRVVGSLPSVVARPVLVEELLGNLLDNAVKYTAPGIAPDVEIEARAEAGAESSPAVVYAVRDRGMGIPPADRERVFGWFVQLQAGDGTGLGLAIARRIVHLHGGKIWIEGNGEQPGVTVCFTLQSEGAA